MKFLVTRKAMKEGYSKIYSVGYCSMCQLLHYQEPIAYSTRAEGWACDYYEINGVLISTGYAPIGESIHYSKLKEYEEAARVINSDYSIRYEERKVQVDKLLEEFVKSL